MVVDGEGQITQINIQSEQLFGYTREELLGRSIEILMPERFRRQHLRHRTTFFTHPSVRPMGRNLDLWGLSKDGREFPVEISLSPFEVKGELLVTAAIHAKAEWSLILLSDRGLTEGVITMAEAKQEKGKGIEKAGAAPAPARALSPFEDMDRMMERFFESFFPRGWLRPFRREWPSWAEMAAPVEGWTPRVDVIDRDNEIVLRAEVPGVDKKDLDVSVTDNTVTIKGSTSHDI